MSALAQERLNQRKVPVPLSQDTAKFPIPLDHGLVYKTLTVKDLAWVSLVGPR